MTCLHFRESQGLVDVASSLACSLARSGLCAYRRFLFSFDALDH